LFDLAWNSFLVVLITGLFLYFCLKKVNDLYAALSLGIFAILMADVNIAGYLNSFYQESGTFFSFLLLVFALHVFYVRRTLISLSVVTVLALILAATKVVFIPSVLIAVPSILIGTLFLCGGDAQIRRITIIGVSLMFLASFFLARAMISTPGNERQANCYHFIFAAAVPRLDPAQGRNYLHELGLDPSLIALSGKDAYQADSQMEKLRPVLTTQLQAKAIAILAFYHPGAFFQSIRLSFSEAGFYPCLCNPPLRVSPTAKTPFKWDAWSRLHCSLFHGSFYFVMVFAVMGFLGALVKTQKVSGWPLFHLILAASFLPAALLQIFISVLGNGPFDIEKHQYLANLLLDAAFVFSLTGLVKLAIALRKKGR